MAKKKKKAANFSREIPAVTLSNAQNVAEALEAAARGLFEERPDGNGIRCPASLIPLESDLAAWIEEGGEGVDQAVKASCMALQKVVRLLHILELRFNMPAEEAAAAAKEPDIDLLKSPDFLLFISTTDYQVPPHAPSSTEILTAHEVMGLWKQLCAQSGGNPLHPLVPLVKGWQQVHQLRNPQR